MQLLKDKILPGEALSVHDWKQDSVLERRKENQGECCRLFGTLFLTLFTSARVTHIFATTIFILYFGKWGGAHSSEPYLMREGPPPP